MMMTFFAASLMVISRIYPATNHSANVDTSAEKAEDKNRMQREEILLKRVAGLKKDVQAANDESTKWMERFHEQCDRNRREIQKASTSMGSQLTYLDLRAQVQSYEIKCKSLIADLRTAEGSVEMHKASQKQKQSKLTSTISVLQGRITRQVRHGRKHIPNTVHASELKREKAESAHLKTIIAQKDRELRAATDRISHLEAESAQIQASSEKNKHELGEKLIRKNLEITKLREKAAKDLSHFKAESAKIRTSSDKMKHDLDEKLGQKDIEIRELREKAAEDLTNSRASASNLEQQLRAKTWEIERNRVELSKKCAELESLNQKVTSLEARDEAMETEPSAPTPSELPPTVSETMDLDSPEQLRIESQGQTGDEQRERIEALDSENEALRRQITNLEEIVDGYRHGDHEMDDAFAADPHGRERELTEGYNQINHLYNVQKVEFAKLQKENESLKAIVGQNQPLERGGRELPEATIARLRKEKEEMSINLQKTRKLADNLKKERDQHRDAKMKFAHENSGLTKSQRENEEELKKLREDKAKLVKTNAELFKTVEECRYRPGPTNIRMRSGSDDEEGEASDKRVKSG